MQIGSKGDATVYMAVEINLTMKTQKIICLKI